MLSTLRTILIMNSSNSSAVSAPIITPTPTPKSWATATPSTKPLSLKEIMREEKKAATLAAQQAEREKAQAQIQLVQPPSNTGRYQPPNTRSWSLRAPTAPASVSTTSWSLRAPAASSDFHSSIKAANDVARSRRAVAQSDPSPIGPPRIAATGSKFNERDTMPIAPTTDDPIEQAIYSENMRNYLMTVREKSFVRPYKNEDGEIEGDTEYYEVYDSDEEDKMDEEKAYHLMTCGDD